MFAGGPSCSRLIYIHFMARKASHFAENWPTSRSNEYRQKKTKKIINGAGQHTSFFTWRASFAKLMNDHLSWCLFVLGFSWEINPSHFMTKDSQTRTHSCFSVSAQTSLMIKRYRERLLLVELSSSLSRIDDVFVNFGEKKVTTRTLHWDAKTSFHLHTVAYDYARTYSVPSQGRRHLKLYRSVDCALAPRFLEPMPVYIHFQAYWACLVVIETNEKRV